MINTYWVVAGMWFLYIFEVSTIGNLNCQPWWCHRHPIPQGCDDDCSVPFFADNAQVLARYSPKSQPSQLPIPQVLSADPYPPSSICPHPCLHEVLKGHPRRSSIPWHQNCERVFPPAHSMAEKCARWICTRGWSDGASAAKASESSSLYNATCGGWRNLGFQDIPNRYKHQAVTHFPGRLRNTEPWSPNHVVPTTSHQKCHPLRHLPQPPQRNDTESLVPAVADRTNSGAGPLPPW